MRDELTLRFLDRDCAETSCDYLRLCARLVRDASERQSRLARCLMALLKQGETNSTSLANSAIKALRRNRQS